MEIWDNLHVKHPLELNWEFNYLPFSDHSRSVRLLLDSRRQLVIRANKYANRNLIVS